MIKLDKYFKKIPSFEIVPPTNNSNSITNDTISSSNTSYEFNLIMDETQTFHPLWVWVLGVDPNPNPKPKTQNPKKWTPKTKRQCEVPYQFISI